jgi:hypothetical protein
MPVDTAAIAPRPAATRSKVANGSALIAGIDGRSAGARRLRDVIGDLTADLGGDLGEAERLQVRTVAGLIVHAERLMADMLNGKPVDSEALTRASNSAARLLTALRAKRTPRGSAMPSLAVYLASKAAEVSA